MQRYPRDRVGANGAGPGSEQPAGIVPGRGAARYIVERGWQWGW